MTIASSPVDSGKMEGAMALCVESIDAHSRASGQELAHGVNVSMESRHV